MESDYTPWIGTPKMIADTCRSFSWLVPTGVGTWLQPSWNWQAFCQNYLKVGILLPTCPSKLDFQYCYGL